MRFISSTSDLEPCSLATDLRLRTSLFPAQPFDYPTRKHVDQKHSYKNYDYKDDDDSPTEVDVHLTVIKKSQHTPMLFADTYGGIQYLIG
jgi:hypothetical protein